MDEPPVVECYRIADVPVIAWRDRGQWSAMADHDSRAVTRGDRNAAIDAALEARHRWLALWLLEEATASLRRAREAVADRVDGLPARWLQSAAVALGMLRDPRAQAAAEQVPVRLAQEGGDAAAVARWLGDVAAGLRRAIEAMDRDELTQ